ncbi:hypothetical protein N7533_004434 [Penicillium manginii]|nr:uncharacterized protein N7533_004434 [Penicillium manginii]KAJ5754891.1 hypothetical protein N7533_004434 [Penicillium manginii]
MFEAELRPLGVDSAPDIASSNLPTTPYPSISPYLPHRQSTDLSDVDPRPRTTQTLLIKGNPTSNTFTMDFSNIFRLVNIAIGVVMVLGGISQFFPISMSSIIVGIYVMIFGAVVAGLEFLPNVPDYAYRYASFLFSFLGRGVFYIFVGCIILHGHILREIAASIVGITGIAYVVLEFIPSIEPPSNMRESDQGWGAEQV